MLVAMIVAKKSFGQNFLINRHILKFIATLLDLRDQNVLEIGPGTGNLTEFLLQERPKNLFCLEKDRGLLSTLGQRFGDYRNLFIFNDDAEKVTIKSFSSEKVFIVSNLPYNVGTKILLNLNLQIEQIMGIVVMLQKEVVQRILAKKNTPEYGKISFLFQYLYDLEFMMEVSPRNFSPAPNVDSAIIKMIPRENCDLNFYTKMNEFLTLCFQFRRKKLSTILRKTKFEYVLNKIDGNKRIEALDFDDIKIFLDIRN